MFISFLWNSLNASLFQISLQLIVTHQVIINIRRDFFEEELLITECIMEKLVTPTGNGNLIVIKQKLYDVLK